MRRRKSRTSRTASRVERPSQASSDLTRNNARTDPNDDFSVATLLWQSSSSRNTPLSFARHAVRIDDQVDRDRRLARVVEAERFDLAAGLFVGVVEGRWRRRRSR
ncbi:MAG: hypothetical protein IPH48_10935 [bacterium]|nr:hypothetical protein [bacterium]